MASSLDEDACIDVLVDFDGGDRVGEIELERG